MDVWICCDCGKAMLPGAVRLHEGFEGDDDRNDEVLPTGTYSICRPCARSRQDHLQRMQQVTKRKIMELNKA